MSVFTRFTWYFGTSTCTLLHGTQFRVYTSDPQTSVLSPRVCARVSTRFPSNLFEASPRRISRKWPLATQRMELTDTRTDVDVYVTSCLHILPLPRRLRVKSYLWRSSPIANTPVIPYWLSCDFNMSESSKARWKTATLTAIHTASWSVFLTRLAFELIPTSLVADIFWILYCLYVTALCYPYSIVPVPKAIAQVAANRADATSFPMSPIVNRHWQPFPSHLNHGTESVPLKPRWTTRALSL